MTNYSAKKIAALVAVALAIFAIGSFSFIGSAFAAPTVETEDASEIGDNSATLNGYLYTDGEDTDYWFEYGTSRSDLDHETSVRNVGDRGGRVTVYNEIRNGLVENRTYYFRLVAENADGKSRGDILSFRTGDDNNNDDSDMPSVQTRSADPETSVATLEGSVDPNGASTRVWFRYGQSVNGLYSTTNGTSFSGDNTHTFSQDTDRLLPGTTYYYQAVAENRYGTDYGTVLQFTTFGTPNGGNGGGTTTSGAPIVVTTSGTANGRTSGTFRASVNPNGTLSSVWFEYGRTASLGSVTTRDPAGSQNSSVPYSATVNTLSAGTTYYFRAVSQNTSGTSRGQILSIRTEAAPVVTPVDPGNGNGGNGGNGGSTPTVTSTPATPSDCLIVTPAISASELRPGQDFTYSVTYKNSCGQTLSNGNVQISLPDAIEFAGTNYPFLSRDGNVITYNLGVIAPNFEAAITVNGKVRSTATTGESLIFQSDFGFTTPSGAKQSADSFLSAMVSETASTNSSSTLGASAADALSGLFHSGWFWLVLFLILIALFVFWLATRRRDGEDDEDGAEEAHHGH